MTACRRAAGSSAPAGEAPVLHFRWWRCASGSSPTTSRAPWTVRGRSSRTGPSNAAAVVIVGGSRRRPMPSCVSIDIDSRSRPAASGRLARDRRHAGAATPTSSTRPSTRRCAGTSPLEIEAAWRASGRRRAIFAPAFPAAGRTTRDGVQLLNGVDLGASSFANDARAGRRHRRYRAAARSSDRHRDPRRRDGRRPRRDRRLRRRRRGALGRLARTRARPRAEAPPGGRRTPAADRAGPAHRRHHRVDARGEPDRSSSASDDAPRPARATSRSSRRQPRRGRRHRGVRQSRRRRPRPARPARSSTPATRGSSSPAARPSAPSSPGSTQPTVEVLDEPAPGIVRGRLASGAMLVTKAGGFGDADTFVGLYRHLTDGRRRMTAPARPHHGRPRRHRPGDLRQGARAPTATWPRTSSSSATSPRCSDEVETSASTSRSNGIDRVAGRRGRPGSIDVLEARTSSTSRSARSAPAPAQAAFDYIKRAVAEITAGRDARRRHRADQQGGAAASPASRTPGTPRCSPTWPARARHDDARQPGAAGRAGDACTCSLRDAIRQLDFDAELRTDPRRRRRSALRSASSATAHRRRRAQPARRRGRPVRRRGGADHRPGDRARPAREGIDATGPLPGRHGLHVSARAGAFDVVVAQYHDQGLIPVKYLGLDDGRQRHARPAVRPHQRRPRHRVRHRRPGHRVRVEPRRRDRGGRAVQPRLSRS